MSRAVRHSEAIRRRVAGICGAALLGLFPLKAGSAEIDFYRDVYPVLKANCISCHNKTTHKAGLNMETPELLRKGGDSGTGVVPGKSADSLVFKAAAQKGEITMPPKGNKTGAVKLNSKQLALLKSWIDQGAKQSVQQARPVVWQPLPPGVNPIYAVALAKDGRYAACGRANQITIYDLATRQFVTRLTDDTLMKRGAPPSGSVAHRGLVQSVAFSPDGTRLASGSFREVKIWRLEKANAISRNADAALGAVVSALTGDGRQIVCGDKNGALHLLDAGSGKILKTIPNVNTKGIKLLSISPDSTKVAVYGADAVFSLWSLPNGKCITSNAGPAGVRTIAWTGDGKAVATAGEDKIVRAGLLLAAPKELKGATGAVTALAAGSGDQLLAASEDGKVRLWSLTEAKLVREFNLAGVIALASSRDGKQFAAGCADGVVRVWDSEAGKQIIELRGDPESARQIAALDWVVAAEGLEMTFQNGESARLEAENKVLDDRIKKATDTIASVKKELPDKQVALKTAKDAKAVAQKAADDAAVLVAKAANAKPDAALEKQSKDAQEKLMAAAKAESAAQSAVQAVETHGKDAEAEVKNFTDTKNKNTNAVATAKAALEIVKKNQAKAGTDLATVRQSLAKENPRPLAVAFSADGKSVAAAFTNGTQRIWAVASGTPLEQVRGTPATAAAITAAADGSFATCTADGATTGVSAGSRWVLERVLGGEKADSPFVDRVNALRFSPDGKMLAAGGGEPSRSGDISLWDVASGKLVQDWKERHSDAVLSLDFSADGKWIASGGADKIARITDIASGKQVLLFEGHTHHVMGVAFRVDGRVLASAGADSSVIIWDMISGERKRKIAGWAKEVTSLQFIGATNQILTSSGDNLVRIVNDDGGEVRALSKLPDFMQSAASAVTASVIIGGGQDSILRVWDGTNGKELVVFGAN